jgi:hypothetical protein
MPQMKIGHLRSIPAPPSEGLVRALSSVGNRLSKLNAGVPIDEQWGIDTLVSDAFALTEEERTLHKMWSETVR